MAARNLSFDGILEEKPSLDELCEHVRIGVKWRQLGIQLKLDATQLTVIDAEQHNVSDKTSEMFHLLLTTKPQTTRRQVLKVLRKGSVSENALANDYEEWLHTSAVEPIIQLYHITLSQYPVKVAQHLFSERCINETTLDEIETLEASLEEKKTILLSAIHTTVSLDYNMLKVLVKALSTFEMKCLPKITAHEMIAVNPRKRPRENEEEFEDLKTKRERNDLESDQTVSEYDNRVTEVAISHSHEDCASDILRCHYGTLSQTLQYPISVAELLFKEKVISGTTLSVVRSISSEEACLVVLRAVRHAVHTSHYNLDIFASVLLKLPSNVPCGEAIFKDYMKFFPENNSPVTDTDSPSQDETSMRNPVPLPQKMRSVFGSIKKDFAIAFNKIQEAINANPPPLNKLKLFLQDGYPHLRPQLTHSDSIDNVLSVVRDHCTLIDISCLESIVQCFDIKEAEIHVQKYKDIVQSFCKETKACLCLGESFTETKTPSHLQCETIVFVLNWNPMNVTLEEIKDLLSESFERNIEIRCVTDGNSITVTCFFPLDLTAVHIAKAQETLEALKERGLIRLVVGYCTIYDKHRRDKEVQVIIEEKTELRSQLELQRTINKKQIMQMERYREETSKMKQEIEKLQQIITLLTSQLRSREEDNERLKALLSSLRESVSGCVHDQDVREIQTKTNQEKDSTASINEKTRDTGRVQWRRDRIYLTSPTIEDCEDVMSELAKQRKTTKKWTIDLSKSFIAGSAQTIINYLNKCAVRELDINDTPLDSDCVSALSEVLTTNKTMVALRLNNSPLSGGTKQVSDALRTNTYLAILEFKDDTITDEDITHLSDMLVVNEALKGLHLHNCHITDESVKYIIEKLKNNKRLKVLDFSDCHITDNGVRYISDGLAMCKRLQELQLSNCNVSDKGLQYMAVELAKSQLLTTLDISYNPSISSGTIADLINTTTSLTEIRLLNTSMNETDIYTICNALVTNKTIKQLSISKQCEKFFETFHNYESIKDRVFFQ